MRDVVPLHPARAGDRGGAAAVHRVVVDGGLEYRAAAAELTGPAELLLGGTVELHPGQADVTLLDVREAVGGTAEVEVLVLGSLQADRALTVTVVLAGATSPGTEDDRPEAFSTVVAPDGTAPFEVTRASDSGGLAVASGTIRNTVVPPGTTA